MINAIYDKGAKPIFSDVDLDTFGSCPYEIEKKISGKTKYVFTSNESEFKSQSDERKFDRAKKLKEIIKKVHLNNKFK